jgi:hypothetical protein
LTLASALHYFRRKYFFVNPANPFNEAREMLRLNSPIEADDERCGAVILVEWIS